jgi:anti-sigma regulatory factor (Ser/Thr protein kinase)
MDDAMEMSIAGRISELPRVANTVGSFLQCKRIPPEAIATVHLALDELLSNVIVWGYGDEEEQPIQVKVAIDVDEGQIWLTIVDEGRPFDPTSQKPPDTTISPELRREGGLGLHLVRNLAMNVAYARIDERNVVEVLIDAK